jgi:hypothetical protein
MNEPKDPASRDLYDDLERRALHDMTDEPDDEGHGDPDVFASLGTTRDVDPVEATLGAYIERHDRVPAFEGIDGQPYTVDIDVEPSDDPDRPFVAFFVFIRWAETGAGIMDHVESFDVAAGQTEELARLAALDLSLYEVKAELDQAIERRRIALEE